MFSWETEDGVCHQQNSAESYTNPLSTELSDKVRSTEAPLPLPCCAEFAFISRV